MLSKSWRKIMAASRSRFYRQVGPRAPLGPGPVIERLRLLSERIECEPEYCCGEARAAAGDDGPFEVDPACLKCGSELVGRREPSILHDCGCGDIQRARHVTGTHSRPRLRRLPRKSLRRACIHNLRATLLQRGA